MALTRRSVLKGAGAAGSLLLAGRLPIRARGEQAAGEPAPRDYVLLSSALLGVEPANLEPAAPPGATPLADAFHAQCREAAPGALEAMLAEYRRMAAGGAAPADAAQRLLEAGGRPRPDGVGALARLTMLMWLYGVWYGGTEAARMPASAEVLAAAQRTDFVVSANAYRNGWIWRFAQAFPAGVPGAPGHWSEPPPSLARFRGEA